MSEKARIILLYPALTTTAIASQLRENRENRVVVIDSLGGTVGNRAFSDYPIDPDYLSPIHPPSITLSSMNPIYEDRFGIDHEQGATWRVDMPNERDVPERVLCARRAKAKAARKARKRNRR